MKLPKFYNSGVKLRNEFYPARKLSLSIYTTLLSNTNLAYLLLQDNRQHSTFTLCIIFNFVNLCLP